MDYRIEIFPFTRKFFKQLDRYLSQIKALLSITLIWFLVGCSSMGVFIGGTIGHPPPERRSGPPPHRDEYPSYQSLHIPRGHLPPPGSCKIWRPGTPPGHQGPPMSCREAFRHVPAGAWVIERLTSDETLIHVHEAHERRPGVIVEVEIYSIN